MPRSLRRNNIKPELWTLNAFEPCLTSWSLLKGKRVVKLSLGSAILIVSLEIARVSRLVGPNMERKLFLTARQTNLVLEVLMVIVIATGVISWLVPLSSARALTLVHGFIGLLIVLIAPFKVRGSVRTGWRRKQRSRLPSAAFGVVVVGALITGIIHTTGLLFKTGAGGPLWIHVLLAAISVALLIQHVYTRPVRPKPTDLDRRGLITTTVAGGLAAAALGGQEVIFNVSGARGADREGTGSIETASFDTANLPRVSWLNDRPPSPTDPETWRLRIGGEAVDVTELATRTEPIVARIDCTGGWTSVQQWDCVSLAELVTPTPTARSVRVRSATGYERLYPIEALDELYLATGYSGEPLRAGHGAPVRLVAPNRRGPNWVKWVSEIEVTERRPWLQFPVPLA